jgi:Spy/CpxP family protein refolding chaperone
MKRVVMAVAVAALLVAAVGAVSAQGPGGRRGGRGPMMGGLGMLRMEEVQQELKMTQPQIDKIDAAQQSLMQKMQQMFQESGVDPRNMTAEDRQKMMPKLQELQIKAVSEILDTTQMARFKQLELQQQGTLQALGRKDVAESLKLTDEQKSKVRELQQKAREEMMSLFQGGGGGDRPTPEEMQTRMKKMQEMRKANDEKALAVLTDAQKTRWTEMTGKPFKFPAFGPGRPGRGGG